MELLREDEKRIASENATEQRSFEAVRQVEQAMRQRQEAVARAQELSEHWRAILGTCANLDNLPDAKKAFLVSIFQKLAQQQPAKGKLWKRAAQMVRPVDPPIPDAVVRTVPPLPPEVEAAADANGKAKLRIEAKIHKLHKHPAPRALNCGRYCKKTYHGRKRVGEGSVKDILYRPKDCGRSAQREGHAVCPYCFRERLVSIFRRAASCILDAPPEPDEPGKPGLKNLPRVGPLHVGETTWTDWETFDRSDRRRDGNRGGLRIRRSDNTVLIILDRPFRGSRPLSPAEASDLAGDAIDKLHPEKNSFRLLGSWDVKQESQWETVGVYNRKDFEAVKQELDKRGIKASPIKSGRIEGLIWQAEAEKADVVALMLACPTFAYEDEEPIRTNSDTDGFWAPHPPEEEHETPFDSGESPWG